MRLYFPQWLYPPKFENEETTRIAGLVNITIWALIAVFIVNGIGRLLIAHQIDFTVWNRIFVILLLLGLRGLMWKNHVYLAGSILCLGLWLILASYMTISGGVFSPILLDLGAIIVIASVLLGSRGTIIFGIICLLTVIVIYVGDTTGRFVSVEPAPSEQRMLVSTLTAFGTIAVAATIGAYSTRNALTQMRRSKQSLHQQNELLQHEIVERKRAQEELARLASIVETTLDFIGIADDHGKVLYINQGGRKLIGLPDNVDVTQTAITDYHPPVVAKKIMEQLLPTVTQAGMWTGETVMMLQDKREIPVLQTILAHRGEGGNIAYYSTIVHDLSIQKKMERQNLEFAVERERFNSFKEFLTTISHDLKTPLSILDLNLYVLEKSDDPELQKRGITTIHEQTKLLQQYILDLLEISHLEQLPDFEFAELNLEQLLVDIIKQFQPHAIEKNLTLTLTAAINLPSVEGDGDELVRAFNNLVGNAINYTPNGGSITVSSNCNSNEVVISVADTGIGISAEALPYIFERAYRAHEARTFHANGTGFGLAIVKKIVELHQGHIDVQSSPSEGSIFRIYLPLSQKLNNPT